MTLALAFVTALGCAPASEADDDAASQAGDLSFSTDRIAASAPPRGTLDPRFAYWEARLAGYAYVSAPELEGELAKAGAATRPVIFENGSTGTFAFFLSLPEWDVVAFEGTDGSTVDFATDANATVEPTPVGDVHAGFLHALRSIWDDDAPGLYRPEAGGTQGLRSFLAERHPLMGAEAKPLVFVGHSLGGALATLAYAFATFGDCPSIANVHTKAADVLGCSSIAIRKGSARGVRVTSVATFGAPRVGGALFADLVGARAVVPPLHRFVHGSDAVAQLPTRDLTVGAGFYHPRTAAGAETAGRVRLHDDGTLELAEDLSADEGFDLRDHGIGGYIEALRRAASARDGSR